MLLIRCNCRVKSWKNKKRSAKNNKKLLFELLLFFRKRKKLESHEKSCENKNFCNVVMPSQDTKCWILEFNQYQKFDKALFFIYSDLECIIEKIDGCKSNPENSSTTKISKHILSVFRSIENKHDIYRG